MEPEPAPASSEHLVGSHTRIETERRRFRKIRLEYEIRIESDYDGPITVKLRHGRGTETTLRVHKEWRSNGKPQPAETEAFGALPSDAEWTLSAYSGTTPAHGFVDFKFVEWTVPLHLDLRFIVPLFIAACAAMAGVGRWWISAHAGNETPVHGNASNTSPSAGNPTHDAADARPPADAAQRTDAAANAARITDPDAAAASAPCRITIHSRPTAAEIRSASGSLLAHTPFVVEREPLCSAHVLVTLAYYEPLELRLADVPRTTLINAVLVPLRASHSAAEAAPNPSTREQFHRPASRRPAFPDAYGEDARPVHTDDLAAVPVVPPPPPDSGMNLRAEALRRFRETWNATAGPIRIDPAARAPQVARAQALADVIASGDRDTACDALRWVANLTEGACATQSQEARAIIRRRVHAVQLQCGRPSLSRRSELGLSRGCEPGEGSYGP